MKRKTKLIINLVIIFALIQIALFSNNYSPSASINKFLISRKMNTEDIVNLNNNRNFLVYTEDNIVEIGHSKLLFYIKPEYRNVLDRNTEIFTNSSYLKFYEIKEGQKINELLFDVDAFQFSEKPAPFDNVKVGKHIYALNPAEYDLGPVVKVEDGKTYYTGNSRFIDVDEKTTDKKSINIVDHELNDYSSSFDSAMLSEFFNYDNITRQSILLGNDFSEVIQNGNFLYSVVSDIVVDNKVTIYDFYTYRDQVVFLENQLNEIRTNRIIDDNSNLYIVQPSIKELLSKL